ncbi:hypothetical protein DFH09DRAFT_1084489 [Mycena vulgaris]|nr:hypothetical protein DFH09DRAFT_1108665 [Mycena vulgaris]KAJ6556787.1 hypothetical protein DFH09DRAFT_1084489 [Mycena vulgaris]
MQLPSFAHLALILAAAAALILHLLYLLHRKIHQQQSRLPPFGVVVHRRQGLDLALERVGRRLGQQTVDADFQTTAPCGHCREAASGGDGLGQERGAWDPPRVVIHSVMSDEVVRVDVWWARVIQPWPGPQRGVCCFVRGPAWYLPQRPPCSSEVDEPWLQESEDYEEIFEDAGRRAADKFGLERIHGIGDGGVRSNRNWCFASLSTPTPQVPSHSKFDPPNALSAYWPVGKIKNTFR